MNTSKRVFYFDLTNSDDIGEANTRMEMIISQLKNCEKYSFDGRYLRIKMGQLMMKYRFKYVSKNVLMFSQDSKRGVKP